MKHTPGPWEVLHSETLDTVAVASAGMWAVPHAVIERCAREDNREANAYLIAAAPELLKALQDMQCMCAAGCRRCDAQKAAIAKATGGTPTSS